MIHETVTQLKFNRKYVFSPSNQEGRLGKHQIRLFTLNRKSASNKLKIQKRTQHITSDRKNNFMTGIYKVKKLTFETKYNLKRPPRIYVKSNESKRNYGSFTADAPSKFDGWDSLTTEEAAELKLFMQNLNAVQSYLGVDKLNELTEYRLRLPMSLIEAIDKISLICEQNGCALNIYEPIISSIIQQFKIAIAQLEGEAKAHVISLLETINLAEFSKDKKEDAIRAVFSELLSLHNKSEKLHEQATLLFDKDKSYSPKAIEGMATGKTLPSKWLVSCAITVLLSEKPELIKSLLTKNDFYILWQKPLITAGYTEKLMALSQKYNIPVHTGDLTEKDD